MKQAFFFDMDGVLFNSMPNHARAWEIVMARHGLHFTQRDCYMAEGCTSRDVILNTYKAQQPDRKVSLEEVEAFYQEKRQMFVELGGAQPMPGAYEVLKAIQAAGKQIWLVTGSAQVSLLDQLNSAFPGIDSPASERCFPSITFLKSSNDNRPRPTSTSVPTTALTILRRKRLARISKYHAVGDI